MIFLADESCDFVVVRALRAAGHDARAVAEESPALPDEAILSAARSEARIVLTEDGDFGKLVFGSSQDHHGVIFLRYPSTERSTLGAAVVELVERFGSGLAFVVLQPGRFCIARFS